MKSKILCLLTLLMFSMSLFSQTVSEETAKTIAQNFWNLKNIESNKAPNSDSQVTFRKLASRPELSNLHIFNSDAGFVIISGDSRVQPILAYSETDSLDINNMAPPALAWIQSFSEQIQYAIDNNIVATKETETMWNDLYAGSYSSPKAERSVVLPMITTKWNQYNYYGCDAYNKFCPEINGEKTIVGCVAVAIGQIMKYWNYPERGTGEKKYKSPQISDTLEVNFGNTTYDWENMDDIINCDCSLAKIDAVATFLYHCGVACEMDYGVEGSGASIADALSAITEHFSYKNSAYRSVRNYSDDQGWISS